MLPIRPNYHTRSAGRVACVYAALIDSPAWLMGSPISNERERELYALCPTHSGRRTVGMIHVCNILIIASAQTTKLQNGNSTKIEANCFDLLRFPLAVAFLAVVVVDFSRGKAMPVKLFTLTLHSSCCCRCCFCSHSAARWLLQLTDNESKLNKIKAKQNQ